MNWTPEIVRAEMDYRVERALGDVRRGTTLEHLRSVRAGRPSWWRRMRHSRTDRAA